MANRVPPHLYFVTSSVFHYLGPAFAVLLFARIDVLGVAWLRIASAALIFAIWRKPWRTFAQLDPGGRRLLVMWGVVLAVMNACFYLAIDRLPLGTVAAIEFLPVIALAALGARTPRNLAALALAVAGVYALTGIHLAGGALGLAFALANAALFTNYIILADRVAKRPALDGVDGLGAAMLVAAAVVTPLAGWAAAPVIADPVALAAGAGVGLSSSVIPYVCDQLALARLPRATYSLMVSLLPAIATVIGVIVLTQIPSALEVLGVAAVVAGVALHAQPDEPAPPAQPPVANIMASFAPAAEPADSSTASATEAIVGSPSPSPGESGRGSGPKPSSSMTIRSRPSSNTRASTRISPGSRSR
jgi:inner membrane transporter RhtA